MLFSASVRGTDAKPLSCALNRIKAAKNPDQFYLKPPAGRDLWPDRPRKDPASGFQDGDGPGIVPPISMIPGEYSMLFRPDNENGRANFFSAYFPRPPFPRRRPSPPAGVNGDPIFRIGLTMSRGPRRPSLGVAARADANKLNGAFLDLLASNFPYNEAELHCTSIWVQGCSPDRFTRVPAGLH